MAYDISLRISGEDGATLDQFMSQVQETLSDLNASWVTVKAGLPTDQQAAAEAKVRTILKA